MGARTIHYLVKSRGEFELLEEKFKSLENILALNPEDRILLIREGARGTNIYPLGGDLASAAFKSNQKGVNLTWHEGWVDIVYGPTSYRVYCKEYRGLSTVC